MRQWLTLAILYGFVGAISAQQTAEAVVRKAIGATGLPTDGKPSYQTWREEGKMTFGGATFPYDCRWTYEPSDKYRFDMTGEMNGLKLNVTFVQNGSKAKETSNGASRLLDGEKLEETTSALHELWVNSLTPLVQDKKFTLSLTGDKLLGKQNCTGVLVKYPSRRDITLYFDKTTGLLAGSATQVKDEFQNWKLVAQEATFSDYVKLPSGEMMFQTMVIQRDGNVLMRSKMSDMIRHPGTCKPEKFKVD